MNDNLSLVILAGNIGNQYKWQKQIDPIGPNKETLLEYSIFDALEIGIRHFVFVINQNFDPETKRYFQHIIDKNLSRAEFILQTTYTAVPRNIYDSIENRKLSWGTGHALLIIKNHINNPFIVIDADHLYGKTVFYKAKELFIEGKILPNRYGLITYFLQNTLDKHKTVSRGLCVLNNNFLVSIKKINNIHFNHENEIVSDEINDNLVFDLQACTSVNFWIFHPSIFRFLEDKFFQFLNKYSTQLDSKFSIHSMINNMIIENQLEVIVRKTNDKYIGMYTYEDKQFMIERIRDLVEKDIYPKLLWK